MRDFLRFHRRRYVREMAYLEWLYKTENDISSLLLNYQSKREEKIIEELVNYISKMPSLSTPSMQLNFESKFLHGHNSMVQFQFDSTNTQRELCDLLLIITLKGGARFLSQRVTFVQAKKASKVQKRYSIDLAQLHLLSKFPKFKGTSGVFKTQEIRFKNLMESLGSYLLFSSDEEFAWCTAPALKRQLSQKKSIRYNDLEKLFAYESSSFLAHLPLEPFFWDPYSFHGVESCATLNRFLQAWSSFALGEPWWIDDHSRSSNSELTSMIRYIANQAGLSRLMGTMNEIQVDNDMSIFENNENSKGELLAGIGGVISMEIDIGGGN